jgi:nitroreductase
MPPAAASRDSRGSRLRRQHGLPPIWSSTPLTALSDCLAQREVLEECLRLAQQALTASYAKNWHFVVVTEVSPSTR